MVTKLTLINGYTVTRDKWLQSDPLSMMTKLHITTGYTVTCYQLVHCYLLSMVTVTLIKSHTVTHYQREQNHHHVV